MKEGGSQPFKAQVSLLHLFFLPQPCNLASPYALSHPPLALSHHYVLMLARPALQIGFAQEWQQRERVRELERERGCDWPPSICCDSRIK